MIRTVIENFLLFILPTVLYVAWTIFRRFKDETEEDGDGGRLLLRVFDGAPFVWLFASGALLVIVTLAAFETTSGGKPGQHYAPSTLRDGQIQPGHID